MCDNFLKDSLIKDGMVYNIEQFCGYLWCDYKTYGIEDYFDDEFKYKHINFLKTFCIFIFSLYIFLRRIDVWLENYKGVYSYLKKTYEVYIGYLMVMGVFMEYNMESNTCSYYHDCLNINFGGGDHLRSSTHYYRLYNEECPSVMELILSYEESNSEMVDDDCGDDCCYIDNICDTYIRNDYSYYDYNYTISKRGEFDTNGWAEPSGMRPLHINSKAYDCYNYQIEELIISYIKLNEEYYDNILQLIFGSFIVINFVIMMLMLIHECDGEEKEGKTSEHRQLRVGA